MAATLLAHLPPAFTQEPSDADRLKKLEEQVKKQQEEIEALTKSADDGISASLSEGLRFRSSDGNTQIHVGGRFQEDLRVILDRPDASRTSPDTWSVHAARLGVDGTFFRDYGFQVEADFPSSATGATPTLKTSFVEWKKLAEFRLRLGQFKAPMCQERLRSALYGDFVEASTLTRFIPGHDIGVQAYGSIDSGLAYQAALVNGRSHLNNAGRSRHDDNDEKELVARLTLSPWAANEESFLRGLRVGLSGSITEIDDVPITGAATVTNFDLSTPELGVTFLDPATSAGTVVLDGRRTRVGAELSWAAGPACLRAEVLLRRDEMVNGALEEDVPTRAWSVAFTWIVTGEEKNPESRIVPEHPFDLEGGWGAFELAGRVARAEVGDEIEDAGVLLAGQATEVTRFTAGVNGWLARNIRISANGIREDYHDTIAFGGRRDEDSLFGILLRFQIDF